MNKDLSGVQPEEPTGTLVQLDDGTEAMSTEQVTSLAIVLIGGLSLLLTLDIVYTWWPPDDAVSLCFLLSIV